LTYKYKAPYSLLDKVLFFGCINLKEKQNIYPNISKLKAAIFAL